MSKNFPAHSKHAETVAKLATGVGTALAAIWFPAAALTQPIIDRLIERWIKKPQSMLIEIVREHGITILEEDQFDAFVPMAYKFFEAAKQGEHERNLRILSRFIAGELGEAKPQPENFISISNAISGISEFDLKVFSCSHDFIEKCLDPIIDNDDKFKISSKLDPLNGIVEPTILKYHFGNTIGRNITYIEDALASLSNRNLMYGVPSSDMSRPDHTGYRLTKLGKELIDKALIQSKRTDEGDRPK